MRTVLIAVLVAVMAGCGRKVVVEPTPAPQQAPQLALHVTNNATMAMNIHVIADGNDVFLGQVTANSTKLIPISGITPGTSVTLKATTADGTHTYRQAGVVLSGTYAWTVP
jgi:hypothetical protein